MMASHRLPFYDWMGGGSSSQGIDRNRVLQRGKVERRPEHSSGRAASKCCIFSGFCLGKKDIRDTILSTAGQPFNLKRFLVQMRFDCFESCISRPG